VVALCVVTYANSVSGAFLWDDEIQIVANENLRSLSNLPTAFTTPFWGFARANAPNQTNFYRPLQTVAYTLAYWFGELSPVPGHVMSLMFHAVASVFVYMIALELGLAGTFALLAGALFAVHPIHSEAVAWIAAFPDVACGAFYFASLWALLRSAIGRHSRWLWTSASLLLLALFSKEMAVTLPVIALFYSFAAGEKLSVVQRLRLLVPFAIVTAIYLAMRVQALGFLATTHTEIAASPFDWFTLGIRVFGQYLWQAMIPHPLVAYHLLELHFADRVGWTLSALALIVTLAVIAWTLRRRFPQAALWYVAFAIMLMPVFYFKGISNALASERYLYIPSLAVVLLAATAVARLPTKAVWIAWVVVAIFSMRTIARNQAWSDAEHLYVATLAQDPNIAHMRINLADILLGRSDDQNAADQLGRAITSLSDARFSQVPYDAYRARIGLGGILARAHDYPRARALLAEARDMYPAGEWSYLYLGGIAMEADNDLPGALALLQKAVQLGPRNDTAFDYLGMAQFNSGRIADAKASFEQALRINPTNRDAQSHLSATRSAR
jgi:tetratricopeptide (TPR) repeat protein